jgi:CRP-like cAMP-binding protein
LAFSNQKLLSIARPVRYAPGARLVRQGEPSKGAFILKKGIVEAQVGLPGGGTLAVAEFRDGDMFGEMALVERGVCTASVFARTGVEGWFVARDDFRAMVASRDPAALEVQREITRVLAGKLRALNARVREHPAAEDRPAHDVPSVVRLSLDKSPSFPWRAFLPALRFFEGFDDYEIEELVAPARAFELERGAWLFAAGQSADACFLVVRGALEIISSNDRVERRVALAGPGELVGWTVLSSTANGTRVRTGVYARRADGTEGGTTVNFVTSAGELAVAHVYGVGQWCDSGTLANDVAAAVVIGTGTAPDPPALDPAAWDVADTLWIAAYGAENLGGTAAYPASYTDGRYDVSGGLVGRASTASARRENAVASEDPGAFRNDFTQPWVAVVIGIRPR